MADLPWIMSAPTPWPYSSPRRAPLPRRTAVDPAWARHPKHLRRPNGQLEEFHYIGALAEALGKSPFSVRRWERESVLPPTPFLHRVRGGPARRLLMWIDALLGLGQEARPDSPFASASYVVVAVLQGGEFCSGGKSLPVAVCRDRPGSHQSSPV